MDPFTDPRCICPEIAKLTHNCSESLNCMECDACNEYVNMLAHEEYLAEQYNETPMMIRLAEKE